MALTATILPTSTVYNDGTIVGEASAHLCLDDSNGDTSYDQFGADGYVSCGFGDMPAALGVDSFKLTTSYKFMGTPGSQQLRMFVVIGGTTYYGSWQNSLSGSYADLTETWTVSPATSAGWTPAVINALSCGVAYRNAAAESIRISYLGGTVTYTPVPANLGAQRHTASMELFLKRKPEQYVTFTGNLDGLAVGMLGIVELEHTAGPHATGIGWEDEVWERRAMAVHEQSVDPNTCIVTTRLKDQRPIRCLVRDLAISDKASGSLGDGIARFSTPGSTWSFARASEQTHTNPVGVSEVVPVDTPAYTANGLALLSAAGGLAACRYYVTNNSTARTWNAAQGTFGTYVRLAAVSGSANQAIAYAYHDASNWAYTYWDGANGRWVFEVRQAGTTYRAIKTATPSTDTWYQIGCRWTGANTENSATAYTLSIWVDRVKGTDAVAAGAMTQAASSNLDFGSKAAAGTEPLNGYIKRIHSYQYVFTDIEMQRTL